MPSSYLCDGHQISIPLENDETQLIALAFKMFVDPTSRILRALALEIMQ